MKASFRFRPLNAKGISLIEIILTISLVGSLALIAIPAYSNLVENSRNAETDDFVESLNRAVSRFSQSNWTIPTAANDSSTDDEERVVLSLQYKWPAAVLKPGSPYFTTEYKPAFSADASKHRIRWTGRIFESLRPGIAGLGIIKSFDRSDQKPCVFPNGFLPAGLSSGYVP